MMNFQTGNIEKTPKELAMDKEVLKRKNEIEEMKEMKEKLIKDFEADKKYNLEVRKSLPQNENKEKAKPICYRSSSVERGSYVGSNNENYEEKKEDPRKYKKNDVKSFNNKAASKMRKGRTLEGSNAVKNPTKKKNVVSLKDYGRTE